MAQPLEAYVVTLNIYKILNLDSLYKTNLWLKVINRVLKMSVFANILKIEFQTTEVAQTGNDMNSLYLRSGELRYHLSGNLCVR